jgi:predicted RNA methylase
MQKKRLFQIHDFVLRHDTIIVQILDNNYIENSLVIPIHSFIQYLLRHDRLYFEAQDMSTGTLVTKTYHLTFDNYWDEMERDYKEQDIYDFIVCTCVDFTKAIDKLILRLNHNLTQYIW